MFDLSKSTNYILLRDFHFHFAKRDIALLRCGREKESM